ncbi:hypothetical protein AZE42_12293 [Rhizopogon vesiculosus]|nr:hypothetical protein AZE42_12293 [Rhizopogon vesiculosus]
MIQLRS